MPSEREAIRRWLGDIQHHIAMAEGFVAGIAMILSMMTICVSMA
jgi:hypothetical protein